VEAHVRRGPHHDDGEHRVQRSQPGASSRAPTSPICTVTRTTRPTAIPMSRRVRGPTIASTSSTAVSGCRMLPNVRCVEKLSAPKIPRPAKNTCSTTSAAHSSAPIP
jgi:hypothetical protein